MTGWPGHNNARSEWPWHNAPCAHFCGRGSIPTVNKLFVSPLGAEVLRGKLNQTIKNDVMVRFYEETSYEINPRGATNGPNIGSVSARYGS